MHCFPMQKKKENFHVTISLARARVSFWCTVCGFVCVFVSFSSLNKFHSAATKPNEWWSIRGEKMRGVRWGAQIKSEFIFKWNAHLIAKMWVHKFTVSARESVQIDAPSFNLVHLKKEEEEGRKRVGKGETKCSSRAAVFMQPCPLCCDCYCLSWTALGTFWCIVCTYMIDLLHRLLLPMRYEPSEPWSPMHYY